MSAELEERITTTLTTDVASVDIAALIAETSAAITEAEAAADAERERALNPILSPDPGKARSLMENAAFMRDRLRTVLPSLQARLTEVKAKEYAARWEPDYEQVRAQRDALADEYAATYSKAVAQLVDLFTRAEAVDKEVSRINGSAADGEHRRLREVELTARGLKNFGLDYPSIAAGVRLPNYERSTVMTWPVPQVPLGVQYVQSMHPLPLPGPDWIADRHRARQQEAARVSAHFKQQDRDQEERERALRNRSR